MFRHVVLFRLNPQSTDDQRRAMIDGLATLPETIAEIRGFTISTDAGESDGNWDLGIVADFDSVDDWRVYRDDARHQQMIAELVRPIVVERAAVQLSL